MSVVRRVVAVLALALPISGCLTTIGTVVGGVHASSMNSNVAVQQGYKPRTSVAKSVALGAGIGLVFDVAFLALLISSDSSQFGH
jgi:hypothetical protein